MNFGSNHVVVRRLIWGDRVGVRGTMINPGNNGVGIVAALRNAGIRDIMGRSVMENSRITGIWACCQFDLGTES